MTHLTGTDCRSEDVLVLPGYCTGTKIPQRTDADIFLLTLWNVPTIPRFKIDQKPSMVCVWTAPLNVLMCPMVNDAMRIALLSESPVARPVIGAKQANLVRNGFVDERAQCLAFDVLNDASDDVAFAADCADHNRLALAIALAAALVPMPVARVAPDNCFVHFDDPGELLHVLDHCGSDLVAHNPSRLVRAEAHITVDLEGAHSLLADQHQMGDSEPIFQRLIRIFKNCPGKIREAVASIAARSALRALPMPCPGMQFIDGRIATARANDALRPSPNDQIRFAVVLSLKERVKLRCGHLMDGLRLLCAGHNDISHLIGELWHV
jgi:hypothetical protein